MSFKPRVDSDEERNARRFKALREAYSWVDIDRVRQIVSIYDDVQDIRLGDATVGPRVRANMIEGGRRCKWNVDRIVLGALADYYGDTVHTYEMVKGTEALRITREILRAVDSGQWPRKEEKAGRSE